MPLTDEAEADDGYDDEIDDDEGDEDVTRNALLLDSSYVR